jgi:hypothetical protein
MKIKEQHGDVVAITSSRENLEDFFFRKIEGRKKELSM